MPLYTVNIFAGDKELLSTCVQAKGITAAKAKAIGELKSGLGFGQLRVEVTKTNGPPEAVKR